MRTVSAIAGLLLVSAGFASAQPAAEEAVETVRVFSVGELGADYAPDFTLAATPDEVTALSVIPPCDPDFDVCLFYAGDAFEGTTFRSAGLRIKQRKDLATMDACMAEQPFGYQGLVPDMLVGNGYVLVIFPGLGDAGAGHFAEGTLYRIATGDACYELETRIGQTQIGNYDPGAIEPFTDEDAAALDAAFRVTLDSVVLRGGTPVVFPPSR